MSTSSFQPAHKRLRHRCVVHQSLGRSSMKRRQSGRWRRWNTLYFLVQVITRDMCHVSLTKRLRGTVNNIANTDGSLRWRHGVVSITQYQIYFQSVFVSQMHRMNQLFITVGCLIGVHIAHLNVAIKHMTNSRPETGACL